MLSLFIILVSFNPGYDLIHLLANSALRDIDDVRRETFRFPHFPVEDPGDLSVFDGLFVYVEVFWVKVPGDGDASFDIV